MILIIASYLKKMKKVGRVSIDEFNQRGLEFHRLNTPVIISGLEEKVFSLTPTKLKERFGKTEVEVLKTLDGTFHVKNTPDQMLPELENMALGEYIDNKLKDSNYYLRQVNVYEKFPALIEEIPFLRFTDKKLGNQCFLWLGAGKTNSPLHYDHGNNFFIQIYGEKRFIILEPNQISNLYPYPLNSQTPRISRVNIFNSDYSLFPKSEGVKLLEASLKPGDVLFVPHNCWHQVIADSVSLGINFWSSPYDFQNTLLTTTRFLPYSYDRVNTLLDEMILYDFKDKIEFCENLLNKGQLIEGAICIISYLEVEIRKLLIEKDIPISKFGKKATLDNNIFRAQKFNTILLDANFSSLEMANTIGDIFKLGLKIIQDKSVQVSEKDSFKLVDDIKSILICFSKLKTQK